MRKSGSTCTTSKTGRRGSIWRSCFAPRSWCSRAKARPDMRIALVHDYLVQDGGAERVLEAFQRVWPKAPTYALLYDPSRMGSGFRNKDIRTSFLQKVPLALKQYKWFMPLMPM